MDVATLGLAVDSAPVGRARDELGRFTGSASAAERAADKWGLTASAAARKVANDNNAAAKAGLALANVWLRLAAIVTGVLAAAMSAFSLQKFISATSEAEKAQAQLAAALKSTGGAAGQSIESLNAHAKALQAVTAYGDEAIGTAQGILLTFTRIRGDVFPAATEAVLDVATAMGMDLKSAALQVGKALNDPILGMTALTRSGIQFTEAQKATVKQMVETGNIVGAQKLILKELEVQFGGSAKAARETLGGALIALKEAWGDLFELGGTASDPLRLSIEGLIKAIQDPAFETFVKTIGALLFGAFELAAGAATHLAKVIGSTVREIEMIDAIVYKAANIIIGSFVAAYEDVKAVWANFPDIMGAAFVGAVNFAIRGINSMVQGAAEGIDKVIDLVNKIPGVKIGKLGKVDAIGELDNPSADRLKGAVGDRNAAVNAAMSKDYLGRSDRAAMDAASAFYGSESGKARPVPPIPPSGNAEAVKAYEKIIQSAQQFIEKQKLETQALGMTAQAAAALRFEQEMMNKATSEGLTLGPAQIAQIKGLAGSMAEAEAQFKNAKFMQDSGRDAATFVANQQMEQQAMFMSVEAADALRFSTEMLNKAKNDNIVLSAEQVAALQASAASMAAAKGQTDFLKDAVATAKSVTTGFLSDMRNGLEQGKGVWQSFGDAALNALNKISDKLFSMAAEKLFESAFGGAGGGFLSGLFGGGGGGSAVMTDAFANALVLAEKGRVFNRGNVVPFKRGGVVSSPTTFPMANGGTGLMGEAGEEGVLPLKRGPSGRLGVSMYGGGGQQQMAPIIKIEVAADSEWVRATARDESGKVVATSAPKIVDQAVSTSRDQVVPTVNRNQAERGGDWRD